MEIGKLDFVIFDEEQSRQLVIDTVQNNPGFIAEAIVKKLKEQKPNPIGRKKFYRILSDLKKENVIEEEQDPKPKTRNAKKVRDKKLFVNGSNPLTVILNELEEFEQMYYLILEKTIEVVNKKITNASASEPETPNYEELFSIPSLFWQPFHIFIDFLKTYLTRLITIWSKVIQDKDVICKLYSMIFTKFAQIQAHSFKIMASSVSEEVVSSTVKSSYIILQSSTTQELKERLRKLKKYGVEEEAKKLLRFLGGINEGESIREYFYAQKKPYRWDLKYKDDELKMLFEDMKKHPDYIYDGLYDDYIESLEE